MAMDKCDVAWAAGLFEGEGSIHLQRTPDGYVRARQLTLTMTDLDVVERFCEVVACGNVKPCTWSMKSGYTNKKLPYYWSAAKYADVTRILDLFMPYFGERRREQAQEVYDNPPLYGRGYPRPKVA